MCEILPSQIGDDDVDSIVLLQTCIPLRIFRIRSAILSKIDVRSAISHFFRAFRIFVTKHGTPPFYADLQPAILWKTDSRSLILTIN